MGNRVLNIGCHLTVTKGYRHMGRRILELGGNTFQYFSRNPRGGSVKAIDAKDAAGLAEIMEANSFAPILTHAPYTLNMAAAKEETWDFAKRCFREDLEVPGLCASIRNIEREDEFLTEHHLQHRTDFGQAEVNTIFRLDDRTIARLLRQICIDIQSCDVGPYCTSAGARGGGA